MTKDEALEWDRLELLGNLEALYTAAEELTGAAPDPEIAYRALEHATRACQRYGEPAAVFATLRTALSEPDALTAKEAECERLREAAKPFVEFFQSRVQHGSEARQDWNERMPDTFPGPENVPLTMGQWRALRAALEET